MSRPERKEDKKGQQKDNRLYTLEVRITGGPMTDEFMRRNPVVSRTIQIKGSQTLERLHEAIFDALDREEEHLYEFQVGKGPHDPKGRRYVMDVAEPMEFGAKPVGEVGRTTIGSLDLRVGQSLTYWFDFGDDWMHEIKVVSIEEEAPKGSYPRVTGEVGESPPQYPRWDEEEQEEEEDEAEDYLDDRDEDEDDDEYY